MDLCLWTHPLPSSQGPGHKGPRHHPALTPSVSPLSPSPFPLSPLRSELLLHGTMFGSSPLPLLAPFERGQRDAVGSGGPGRRGGALRPGRDSKPRREAHPLETQPLCPAPSTPQPTLCRARLTPGLRPRWGVRGVWGWPAGPLQELTTTLCPPQRPDGEALERPAVAPRPALRSEDGPRSAAPAAGQHSKDRASRPGDRGCGQWAWPTSAFPCSLTR